MALMFIHRVRRVPNFYGFSWINERIKEALPVEIVKLTVEEAKKAEEEKQD